MKSVGLGEPDGCNYSEYRISFGRIAIPHGRRFRCVSRKGLDGLRNHVAWATQFSQGREIHTLDVPFSAAAFSPCLPKPKLDLAEPVSDERVFSSFPPHTLETNDGAAVDAVTGTGSALLAWSRHDVMERLDLADSRKTRPTKMWRQPIEKRKKAATRVKVSTWWERMAAPILLRRC